MKQSIESIISLEAAVQTAIDNVLAAILAAYDGYKLGAADCETAMASLEAASNVLYGVRANVRAAKVEAYAAEADGE